MNRRAAFPIVVALAALIAPASAADISLDERALTVMITTPSSEGIMIGAGVVFGRITDLTVLTAAHVLKESSKPVVRTPDGLQFAVRSIENVPGHDLALIHVDPPAAPFRVAVRGRPVAGEPLAVWGHPRGKAFTLSRGMVLDVDPQLAIVPVRGFTIACPSCDLGDSGAGVFDERGALLGILVSAIVNSDGHKLGVWTVEALPPEVPDPLPERGYEGA